MRVGTGFGVALLAGRWLLGAGLVQAAVPTPELQQAVRAATFEVVMHKLQKEPLSYEKPLPLELIPFVERNDAYWSVGTAFAIGDNSFVSAAHVMTLGVNTQFGPPSLRDSSGKVYTIDRVLKFSQHEDYMVFTVANAPQVTPLSCYREPKLDAVVFAVGNAMGEGVVIRDGLFTSETPEAQDGRWKWIRFSAAASPGNSGGPLLDSDGRVIGVVLAKSPNENLNYALPIGHVLDGSASRATFDERASFGLPILKDTTVAALQLEFPLPRSYAEFAAAYEKVLGDYAVMARTQLLREHADTLLPKGQTAKLFATTTTAYFPRLVKQDADGVWQAKDADEDHTTDLADDGFVQTGMVAGTTLVRLRRSGFPADAGFYRDSKQYMDALLKGLKIPRVVGTQQVLITSMGAAQLDTKFRDGFGRQWQERAWPLGFADAWLISLGLPTPDGYVGMLRLVPSISLAVEQSQLRLMADYFYVSYNGTLPQWRAFLADRELRPQSLDAIRLSYDYARGLELVSPRWTLTLPRTALALSDQSALDLRMTYELDHDKLAWGVGAADVYSVWDKQTYVSLYRQPMPAGDAGHELSRRWSDLVAHAAPYDGVPGRDSSQHDYWVISSVAAGPGVVYELRSNLAEQALPRDLEQMQRALTQGLKLLEH